MVSIACLALVMLVLFFLAQLGFGCSKLISLASTFLTFSSRILTQEWWYSRHGRHTLKESVEQDYMLGHWREGG